MTPPKKCISIEKAKELQKTWNSTRGKAIEHSQGHPDARDFWYSLDELQEYLVYVKKISTAQGVKNPGIRIFLGAYPKTKEQDSKSTLFLAPTKKKVSQESGEGDSEENNYEIEPLNSVSGGWPPEEY